MREELIEPELFRLIAASVTPGKAVRTVSTGKPNRVVSIDLEGLTVETEKSLREGRPPQAVPGWMFNEAWRQLSERSSLTQRDLLRGVHGRPVHRSAAVFAVLAQLECITVMSTRPTELKKVS